MKLILNKSEMCMLVKEYEDSDISREIDTETLINVLKEKDSPYDYRCPLSDIKYEMERYIQNNIIRLKSQLPGCNGKCTTYGCPDGVVTNCHMQLGDYNADKT